MQNIDRFLQELQETPEGRQIISVRRLKLFREIHEIVFHGKGGYDFHTIYTMPVWLRHFIYSEIRKYYQEEAAEIDKVQKGGSTPQVPKGPPIRKPDISLKPRK